MATAAGNGHSRELIPGFAGNRGDNPLYHPVR
jgi:hypothetical protein